ncbi:MAG: hypothetical protein ACRC6U_09145 [Fusobacteriaceae bacterium]
MENNKLMELQNNSLIIDKFKEPVQSVEEGIKRIKDLKADYERIIETVTERKFYIEGKTLCEMREIESRGRTGTWTATYEKMGYDKHQVMNLIRKYEIAENLIGPNGDLIEENKIMLDNLEKLSRRDTNQLEKLKLSEAQAILESENSKLELKKLREQAQLDKESLKLELQVSKGVILESDDTMKLLESEISKLSKELNSRPTVEKEIEKIITVEKLIEKEIVPSDYIAFKNEVEKYKIETEKRKKEIEELKSKAEKQALKLKELKILGDVRLVTDRMKPFSNLLTNTCNIVDDCKLMIDSGYLNQNDKEFAESKMNSAIAKIEQIKKSLYSNVSDQIEDVIEVV